MDVTFLAFYSFIYYLHKTLCFFPFISKKPRRSLFVQSLSTLLGYEKAIGLEVGSYKEFLYHSQRSGSGLVRRLDGDRYQ